MSDQSPTHQQQVVGKYVLGKVLGSGDFDCRVRLCTNSITGLPYAVRIYDKAILSEAPWIWHQLAEAVQVMRTMPKHVNIIEMVECFETTSSLFILMNFVQGASITRVLYEYQRTLAKIASGTFGSGPLPSWEGTKGGSGSSINAIAQQQQHRGSTNPSGAHAPPPLTAEQVALKFTEDFQKNVPKVFVQLMRGIAHMHANNFVHLGIAPDHILVTDVDHIVKVTFLVMCRNAPRDARFHVLTGTTHTVAPEVLRQLPEGYDPRKADAWSCGVVLYFLLSGGTYPFSGANAKRNILDHNIRPLDPRLPPAALDLVAKLLHPDPDLRLSVEGALSHPYLAPLSRLARVYMPSKIGVISYFDEEKSKIRIYRNPATPGTPEYGAIMAQHCYFVRRWRRARQAEVEAERESNANHAMSANLDHASSHLARAASMKMTSAYHRSNTGEDEDDTAPLSPAEAFLKKLPRWATENMCKECHRMPPPLVEPGKPLPFPDVKHRYVGGRFVAVAAAAAAAA